MMLQLLLALAAATAAQLAAAANYTACGVTSTVAFNNWVETVATQAPLVFPTTEAELKALVTKVSKVPGCKLRVAGTGGSIDGLVALKQDTDTVVVNLADLKVDTEWDGVLDKENARVRMSAGKTVLDLNALIRPQGYLVTSRSYGRYFTLGGFFMNPSTHGATFGADRAAKQVTGLRVLLSTGKFVNIKDKASLADFRGSLGLLGIVVALEIQLMKDQGIVQQVAQKAFSTNEWNKGNLTKWVSNAILGADAGHFYYNFWENKLSVLLAYNKGDPTFNYSTDTAPYYAYYQSAYPTLAKFGMPKMPISTILNQIPAGTPPTTVAAAVMSQAETIITQGWLASNAQMRDGYVIDLMPLVLFHALENQIPCPSDCIQDGTLWSVLNGQRTIIGETIAYQNADEPWYPNFLTSIRIFTVSDDVPMTLNALKPGKYLATEFGDTDGIFKSTAFARPFKRYEAVLQNIASGVKPHMGKEYAYAPLGCYADPFPFQQETFISNVFSAQVKKKFAAAMKKYDPKKLFSSGSALRLLGLGDEGFDPRNELGGSCTTNGDCIDSCCCDFLPRCTAASLFMKCVPCDSPLL